MANLDMDRVSYRILESELDKNYLQNLVQLAYDEDLSGAGWVGADRFEPIDVTTDSVIGQGQGQVHIVARKPLRFSGRAILPIIAEVYGFDGDISWYTEDGEKNQRGDKLASLRGEMSTLLKMERVILNFFQHLSGIATNTDAYVQEMGGTQTRLLDTRKTTPGYRAIEKYAVACGGAWNHRMGLYDRVLIKDNHLAAAGSTSGERLKNAVCAARSKNPDLLIEVEIDHQDQLKPVLDAGADIIMLDNFSPAEVEETVPLIKEQAFIEVSGGITIETIGSYCLPGVHFISSGALVHQARWIDIGFDWE